MFSYIPIKWLQKYIYIIYQNNVTRLSFSYINLSWIFYQNHVTHLISSQWLSAFWCHQSDGCDHPDFSAARLKITSTHPKATSSPAHRKNLPVGVYFLLLVFCWKSTVYFGLGKSKRKSTPINLFPVFPHVAGLFCFISTRCIIAHDTKPSCKNVSCDTQSGSWSTIHSVDIVNHSKYFIYLFIYYEGFSEVFVGQNYSLGAHVKSTHTDTRALVKQGRFLIY